MNKEELINKIITYNYNNFGNEFGNALVDLQQENKELHNKIDKVIRMLEINIEIAKQQPSKNKLEDEFFINRCNDLLKILKDSDVDE